MKFIPVLITWLFSSLQRTTPLSLFCLYPAGSLQCHFSSWKVQWTFKLIELNFLAKEYKKCLFACQKVRRVLSLQKSFQGILWRNSIHSWTCCSLSQSAISICACDGLEGDSSVLGYPDNIKELKETKKKNLITFFTNV